MCRWHTPITERSRAKTAGSSPVERATDKRDEHRPVFRLFSCVKSPGIAPFCGCLLGRATPVKQGYSRQFFSRENVPISEKWPLPSGPDYYLTTTENGNQKLTSPPCSICDYRFGQFEVSVTPSPYYSKQKFNDYIPFFNERAPPVPSNARPDPKVTVKKAHFWSDSRRFLPYNRFFLAGPGNFPTSEKAA